MGKREAPKGWRFDPFADVRMGQSLFQMQPEDWLVKDEAATQSDKRGDGR